MNNVCENVVIDGGTKNTRGNTNTLRKEIELEKSKRGHECCEIFALFRDRVIKIPVELVQTSEIASITEIIKQEIELWNCKRRSQQ